MDTPADFYDSLTPFYHLIHQDWDESIRRQGEQLTTLIDTHWKGARKILDVSCGIGTQALALSLKGYEMVASDLSEKEIARAKREADKRGLKIPFSIADMRGAHVHHGGGFDVVISADNSLPHLLTDEDILTALTQMHSCLKPGGGCILTVRDYDSEPTGRNIVKPYGVRVEDGKRYLLFQVWDFEADCCIIAFYFLEEDSQTHEVKTHVMRSKYYAISISKLMDMMKKVGFKDVRRLDDTFYQPVLVGTRS
jgi:SAM-dependent methyltransferase